MGGSFAALFYASHRLHPDRLLDLAVPIRHIRAKIPERLMSFLNRMLTWWNTQTLGTQIFTARRGIKVGEDTQGNLYYQTADSKRRWVIYNGEMEASRVSPDWHGWLHFTWDQPPTTSPLPRKVWEKPHRENLTGSAEAYAPPGSIRQAAPVARADYEAWQPK